MQNKVDKVSEDESFLIGFMGIGIIIGLAVFLFQRKPKEYKEVEVSTLN